MDPLTVASVVSGTYMFSKWVYHRYIEDKPGKARLAREIQIPRIDPGAAYPIVYGQTRVMSPVLAWTGPVAWSAVDEMFRMDLFYVLGYAMNGGAGTSRIINAWCGDRKFLLTASAWGDLTGGGGYETPVNAVVSSDRDYVGGNIEFLNGRPAQTLVSGASADTYTGERMMDSGLTATQLPGYRGLMCAFCFHISDGFSWFIGRNTTVPAMSFEVRTHEESTSYPVSGVPAQIRAESEEWLPLGSVSSGAPIIGWDANPANVIYDLLTGTRGGKLGIPASYIDTTSFYTAGLRLYQEQHGFSGVFDATKPAEEHIYQLLAQIDGVLYEDTSTGKLCLYLVRNDYSPPDLVHLTKDNIVKLTNFSMGSLSNLTNTVKIIFSDRGRSYLDGEAVAQNTASAVNGRVIEAVIEMRGISNEIIARRTAARELAARCRPIIKLRALVDRSMVRVHVGQPLKVTYQKPDLAGIIFRVAAVDRGTTEDGTIALDLISDSFAVYRDKPPRTLPELKFGDRLML